MKENLGKLFYKDYFSNIRYNDSEDDKTEIKRKNEKLTMASLFVINNECNNSEQCISVKIQYPGLVTGVGINHEAKIEGEFKLGVHFDYTYGMPVIYGSSVKGLLRSAFPQSASEINKEKNQAKYTKKRKISEAKTEFIKDYLKEIGVDFNAIDIDELRDEIFEGKKKNKEGEMKPVSIYKRDIFFDAVIITPNEKKLILESDSITPHIKKGESYEESMLKNPVPLTFLKIASGVTMEFRFSLQDGIIKASQKKDLFKKILLDLGIGAKTNVGYGQFH